MSGPAMLDLSLSELRALVTKAARGAGMAWGLAEETGWAAEWLARRGLPSADWAAAWLGAWAPGAACPVWQGTALADAVLAEGQGALAGALPAGLPAPGFLMPFLHRALRQGQSLSLTAPQGLVARLSGGGALALGPAWDEGRTGAWSMQLGAEAAAPGAWHGRAAVRAPVIEQLEVLALRTTVPPTAASRADAGSASGDND